MSLLCSLSCLRSLLFVAPFMPIYFSVLDSPQQQPSGDTNMSADEKDQEFISPSRGSLAAGLVLQENNLAIFHEQVL